MLLTALIILGGTFYSSKKIVKKVQEKKQLAVKEKEELSGDVFTKENKEEKTQAEIREEENNCHKQKVNRNLAVTGITLGGILVVSPFFAPISLLAIPVILYSSRIGLQKTIKKLKRGVIGADILNFITILGFLLFGFYILGLFALFSWSLAQKFIIKIHHDSHNKLVDVFQQMPKTVWVMIDNVELSIPFQDIQIGDIIVAYAGEVISVDGIITEGMASVDQQILTGESIPIDKGLHDEVFASTTILTGKILICVKKAGNQTTVAKVGQVLNNMVDFKSSKELKAERLADKTTLPTLIAGGIAFPILGSAGALAVLGSHFTNKLRMASSLSILNYLNIASKHHILIKDGRALEWLTQVDTIIFDKTGTLTEDQPTVGFIHATTDYNKKEVLRYAAAAEYKQTHPVAKAIIQEADKQDLILPSTDESEYQLGYGLTVQIAGKIVRVGSKRFIEKVGIDIPKKFEVIETECYEAGHSIIMITVDEQLIGAIELLPTLRQEAYDVIQQLRQLPQIKHTYILSGDHEMPTRKLAKILSSDHYFAGILPEDKANIIKQLQQEGKFICYIGDGINDAIALKQADVSVSLKGASTVATDSAQIILLDKGLLQLNLLFKLAKTYNRNMDVTLALVVSPTFIGIAGAYLLGFGLVNILFLSLFSLLAGTMSAMFPLFYQPLSETKKVPVPLIENKPYE
jgi:Cu2+-exporting ATPase